MAVTYTYYTFQCPTPRTVPPFSAETPPGDERPSIFFNDPIKVGENIFVDTAGVISLQQPSDWEDVFFVYLGGHIYTITGADATALVVGGYTPAGPFTSTTMPGYNGPSGTAGTVTGPPVTPPVTSVGFGVLIDSLGNLYVDTTLGGGYSVHVDAKGNLYIDTTVSLGYPILLDSSGNLYVDTTLSYLGSTIGSGSPSSGQQAYGSKAYSVGAYG